MTTNVKTVSFWVIGSLCLLFAILVGSEAKLTAGLEGTSTSFIVTLIISFVLILVGGLLWISVAGFIGENV